MLLLFSRVHPLMSSSVAGAPLCLPSSVPPLSLLQAPTPLDRTVPRVSPLSEDAEAQGQPSPARAPWSGLRVKPI